MFFFGIVVDVGFGVINEVWDLEFVFVVDRFLFEELIVFVMKEFEFLLFRNLRLVFVLVGELDFMLLIGVRVIDVMVDSVFDKE